uniref:Uncharacterized protein n=1 Tax=Hippocampus comes TaxID=109280 RepID=A0A3Q3D364_HIPCM
LSQSTTLQTNQNRSAQIKPARILSLGDFFLVRCKPDEPVCVAELQLLWEERTSRQLLSSSKLYFLPEDTPQGRGVSHGEHEVIAVSEKVIVRLQDLVKWTVPDLSGWAHGLKAEPLKASALRELGTNGRREALHQDGRKVLVLSYPQYCRYRSVLVRLREQPGSLLLNHTVLALGGIAALGANTRILYCRDTFEHPTLLRNESICDHFGELTCGRSVAATILCLSQDFSAPWRRRQKCHCFSSSANDYECGGGQNSLAVTHHLCCRSLCRFAFPVGASQGL